MYDLIRFSEHPVEGGFTYAYGVSAANIAGSGAPDLVAANGIATPGTAGSGMSGLVGVEKSVGLYWFENDSEGDFTQHVIHTRSDERLERHAIADINGDGRPEIVIVDNMSGSLLWFEYEGDPRDKDSWSHHYISDGGLPGAYDVTVADFDGDGNLDVAASSWIWGNQFAWFENRGDRWVKHVIEENVSETMTIRAADINGNGRMDLLGTGSGAGQVIWYENPGDPANKPWKKHVIYEAPRPVHGHPVDMDGDRDVDVVMALGFPGDEESPRLHQIVWDENDGSPERGLWKKHVICESFANAFEAFAADLDGDGQMEVVATAWGEDTGRVAVFKHHGDPRGPWSMQMLKDGWSKANQVFVADLDGDGRPDIVASAKRGSNEVRWWRNEGPR